MSTIFYKKAIILSLSVFTLLATGCKKEKPAPDPVIEEDLRNNCIIYNTSDRKSLSPNYIDGFGSNYVSSVYDYENGHGIMYFDGPVTQIREHAFDGCDRLESITLPSSVDKVCDYAFANCPKLGIVNFNDAVKSIGKYAFSNCTGLYTVIFKESIRQIDDYAFDGAGVYYFDFRKMNSELSISEKIKGDNPSFFMILVSNMNVLEAQRSKSPGLIKYLVPEKYDLSKIDGTNWTYYLPQGLTLRDLTIPGTHDAATWSAEWEVPIEAPTKKDQDYTYNQTYKWGVRAFDLRLGVNHDSEGNWNYYFVHGDITYLSLCNKISEDAPRFPSIDQLENSFLILFAKDDYNSHKSKFLDCFTDLIEQLKDKRGYDYDRYIAYSDDLTLDECRGKIILFTRTEDYLKYNKNAIYINHLTDNEIEVYRNATKVSSTPYPVMVQDEYEVDKAEDKIGYINGSLEDRIASGNRCLFIDQFNACSYGLIIGAGWGYYFSWPVASYVNPYMVGELAKDELNQRYCQPLGIVYYDMCGVGYKFVGDEDYYESYEFGGDDLAPLLWQHNFHKFWDVTWPKQ